MRQEDPTQAHHFWDTANVAGDHWDTAYLSFRDHTTCTLLHLARHEQNLSFSINAFHVSGRPCHGNIPERPRCLENLVFYRREPPTLHKKKRNGWQGSRDIQCDIDPLLS